MKSKTIFTRGMTGEGVVGGPSVDTQHGPKTKSFGYQVLGFGSGGGPNTYNVQYLVVAGGASGNNYYGAGGAGAGGMRIISCKTFEVTKCETYPIQVGGGGPNAPAPVGQNNPTWAALSLLKAGEPSIFSTITSAGGGTGGGYAGNASTPWGKSGRDGGSGGGAGAPDPAPSLPGGGGNVPAIPAPLGGPQGNPGGTSEQSVGGGGGGHAAAGQNSPGAGVAGAGGNGTATDISGASVTYAGGGGGGSYSGGTGGAAGGSGGGGAGGSPAPSGATTGIGGGTNTGGGGGGAGGVMAQSFPIGPGGPGIVILRRLTACSCSTSGTDSTCGSDTIHKFTGDGTFVA